MLRLSQGREDDNDDPWSKLGNIARNVAAHIAG